MPSMYTWILDPGHMDVTLNGLYLQAGKQSPNVPPGIYEGEWTHDVARRVHELCQLAGIDSIITSPGVQSLPQSHRVSFVRKVHKVMRNCRLISIHANASKGGWTRANGFVVFVSPTASPASRALGTKLFDLMSQRTPIKRRRIGIKTARFDIIHKTPCPAVLLEAAFMTNRGDSAWLASPESRKVVSLLIFDAIRSQDLEIPDFPWDDN